MTKEKLINDLLKRLKNIQFDAQFCIDDINNPECDETDIYVIFMRLEEIEREVEYSREILNRLEDEDYE